MQKKNSPLAQSEWFEWNRVPTRSLSPADDREVPAEESGNGPLFFSGPVSTGKVDVCFEKHNFGPDKSPRKLTGPSITGTFEKRAPGPKIIHALSNLLWTRGKLFQGILHDPMSFAFSLGTRFVFLGLWQQWNFVKSKNKMKLPKQDYQA